MCSRDQRCRSRLRERVDDALDRAGQEVAPCSLSQQRADFLVVEEADELDNAAATASSPTRRTGALSVEERLNGGPGADLVVYATSEEELVVEASELGRLGVEELELPVHDGAVVCDVEFPGDGFDEARRLCRCE